MARAGIATVSIALTYGVGSVAGLSGQVWVLDLATFFWPFLVAIALFRSRYRSGSAALLPKSRA